ncbi:MAG: translation elongation factor Ts [Leptospirales bacterium]
MAVDTQKLKELRSMTSAGILDCKKALEENDNDLEKSAEYLRKKGIVKAVKKMDREATEGGIFSYIHHNGKLGVLLQLNCETDFVAKNDMFKELGKNIAMHIAASNPVYISPDEVPEDIVNKERDIQKETLLKEGKPENVIEKILEGKMAKYVNEISLLKQAYVKDPKSSIEDLLKEGISKLGENISIGKFTRYSI